ncbi:GTP-binding protein [Perkinsela sp. CCAP 1560/4]|nr:GTP-binding protein [Perkinsela sp. CCAP 1560/4]|eukprot:KNH04779.1 GTP-binding protein [Perkinsela sp. CCAP 1560/4]
MYFTKLLLASKATSSYCKNAYKSAKRRLVQFQYNVNDLAPGSSVLLPQRFRYDHRYFQRQPTYQAGEGVRMNRKTYTLKSKHRGVMTIRRSVVNDSYKWVEMDYDIHKAYCTKFMRKHYQDKNEFLHYHPENDNVRQEYHIMRWMNTNVPYKEITDPKYIYRWHEQIQQKPHPLERFQDPNMLAKCPEKLNGPVIRRRYVWD